MRKTALSIALALAAPIAWAQTASETTRTMHPPSSALATEYGMATSPR